MAARSSLARPGGFPERGAAEGMPMASANVQTFTDANFEQEVLKSPLPVLVDFWAEWCQPCKMLMPRIEALADEHAGKIKVGKMDLDTNRASAMTYRVMNIPTVILFKGGQPIKMLVGLNWKNEDLLAALDAPAPGAAAAAPAGASGPTT